MTADQIKVDDIVVSGSVFTGGISMFIIKKISSNVDTISIDTLMVKIYQVDYVEIKDFRFYSGPTVGFPLEQHNLRCPVNDEYEFFIKKLFERKLF
jgi:hypothetical protein